MIFKTIEQVFLKEAPITLHPFPCSLPYWSFWVVLLGLPLTRSSLIDTCLVLRGWVGRDKGKLTWEESLAHSKYGICTVSWVSSERKAVICCWGWQEKVSHTHNQSPGKAKRLQRREVYIASTLTGYRQHCRFLGSHFQAEQIIGKIIVAPTWKQKVMGLGKGPGHACMTCTHPTWRLA